MLRRMFGIVGVVLAMAGPAVAQSACVAPRGQSYTVAGVAAGDVLNLRSGAGTDNGIVAALPNGTRGLIATGRVRFTREKCAIACAQVLDGLGGLGAVLEADCYAKGRIWYELREPRGKTGWAAAQFLRAGTAPPPPPPPAPPPVVKDEALRLVCRSGETLDVVLRARTKDALVITGDGLDLVLPRVKSGLEVDYASREFGGIGLKGTKRRATWVGPGQPETLCVPRG